MDSMKEEKEKGTSGAVRFLGVRQRPSGRWVAEIKVSSQKLRLWLGTYDRPEEAARAYDFAARILRGRNAKTNFPLMNEASVIQVPLKNHRLQQLVQCEELSSCVHETVVCSSASKREGLSAGFSPPSSSSGRSRVYSSVVVAPSFAGGFSEERCEGVSL